MDIGMLTALRPVVTRPQKIPKDGFWQVSVIRLTNRHEWQRVEIFEIYLQGRVHRKLSWVPEHHLTKSHRGAYLLKRSGITAYLTAALFRKPSGSEMDKAFPGKKSEYAQHPFHTALWQGWNLEIKLHNTGIISLLFSLYDQHSKEQL